MCEMIRTTAIFEFGTVQTRVNLVDVEKWHLKMLQNELLVAKLGFDAAENGPSKLWIANTNTDHRTPLPPWVKQTALAGMFFGAAVTKFGRRHAVSAELRERIRGLLVGNLSTARRNFPMTCSTISGSTSPTNSWTRSFLITRD